MQASKRIALLFFVAICSCLRASATDAACGSGQEALLPALSAAASYIEALNARLSANDKPLLAQRRGLVEQLMHEHPEQVRSIMLSPARAATLLAADPGAAAFIETDQQFTGELTLTVADDFVHGTATNLYHLHTSNGDIDLFPTHPLQFESLLHHQVTVSGVATSAVMAIEHVQSSLVSTSARAFVAPRTPSPLTCSTFGVQKTVVLILKFTGGTVAYPTGLDTAAYWQQAVAGSSDPSVSNYWNEVSYGQTSATTDVFGPITLPQVYDCTTTSQMQTAAIAAASATVDFSQYNRIILVYPTATCAFGGLGDLGCVGATSAITHPYSVVWLPVLASYSTTFPSYAGDLTHELGHNLGLNHANTLDFGSISLGPLDYQATNPGTVGGGGSTTASGAITGVNTEYGDNFSTMGGSAFGASGPYSALHRAKILKWIPDTDFRYATTSGVYTLSPTESLSGLRALRVLRDPISSSSLWIEYHQPTGHYESANLAAYTPNNIAQGAMIHYDDGFADPTHTYQLDMTPSATPNNFKDENLLPGITWSDPYSLLNITTNSATSTALNVSISYSTPCATLALSSTSIPAAGGTGTLTIAAPSTCSWTTFSNAAWVTLGAVTSGTGNGTVAYTAAANTTQDQRVTYITAQRQGLRLSQEGTTLSMLGVTPSYGSATGGVSTVFTLSIDDPAGAIDLQQVNYAMTYGSSSCQVAVTFSGTIPFFFLYDSALSAYTSSVIGGSSGSISTTACTLSGTRSTLSTSGGTIAISMDLGFPITAPGLYAITANVGAHTHNTSTFPFGTFIVNGTPSITLSPSAIAQGNTVSVNINGYQTHFTSSTVITADTPDITSSAINALNPSSVTSALTVASNAAPGLHTLTITTGAEAATAPFTVTIPVPSSTTLTGPASVLPGVSVSLTAVVTGGASTKPIGTATFLDGTTTLGAATLDATGTAVYSTSFAVGTHPITAVYTGDAVYGHSTSPIVNIIAAKGTPTPAITTSAAQAFPGNSVTLTATLSATGATPSGIVTFFDNTPATVVGTGTLSGSGVATLSLTNLSTGAHAIGFTYPGSSMFNAATSATTPVTISDFALSAPASITFAAGATTGNSATLTVTPGAGGFASAITFSCSGAPSASSCAVSPVSITPGVTNATATVTVTTTARPALKANLSLFGLLVLGVPIIAMRRRIGRLATLLGIALLLCAGLTLTGCGSSGSSSAPTPNPGTPAGPSTITITATASSSAGTLTHTTSLTVVVN